MIGEPDGHVKRPRCVGLIFLSAAALALTAVLAAGCGGAGDPRPKVEAGLRHYFSTFNPEDSIFPYGAGAPRVIDNGCKELDRKLPAAASAGRPGRPESTRADRPTDASAQVQERRVLAVLRQVQRLHIDGARRRERQQRGRLGGALLRRQSEGSKTRPGTNIHRLKRRTLNTSPGKNRRENGALAHRPGGCVQPAPCKNSAVATTTDDEKLVR